MAFDPTILGFSEIKRGNCGKAVDYCYIIMSQTTRGRRKTITARLVLDEETAAVISEMFGERVGVAIDKDARIVIYAGNMRKLSSMERGSKKKENLKRTISLESEAENIIGKLGQFRHYKYESRIWAKGEAILLTPSEKID